MNDLVTKIKNLKSWVVEHRRYLHQYPELSLHEHHTSRYCQKILEDLGYTITPGFEAGFIADLIIPGAKGCVAFRAEMDALPIQELNKHAFVSQNHGVAHMCGHDAHMAIALLTAKVLHDHQNQLHCNIRFVFQPSEEQVPGGALGMIATGCLDGVDAIYGLHTTAQADVGEIWIREGVLMGASSPFILEVIGKGCHAGKPEEGLSPITAAVKIVEAWQAIPKAIHSEYPPILSVTVIQAGKVNNVIPETATLMGALRAFSNEDLQSVRVKMQEILKSLESQGYQFKLSYQEGYRCVVNSAMGVQTVLDATAKIPGVVANQAIKPLAFVEDYCYYLEHKPGAFFFLGAGNQAEGVSYPLHSPHYDIDEDALLVGANIMANIALERK